MPSQDIPQQVLDLQGKVEKSSLPQDLRERLLERLRRIGRIGAGPAAFDELDRTSDYIEHLVRLPWAEESEDILDIGYAKEILDRNHYGLEDIKNRILEYLAILKLNKERGLTVHAPIFCFVGLVGTGKTTVAFSIAQALGKRFYRIPFGGIGSPFQLRGQAKMYPEAEPGQIIKALESTKVKNPVILLDEIDRVDPEGRAAIMGVLVELLDPEQNHSFVDYYIDYPFDLSEVLFIATANNTTNIATAVLDRLEVVQMPSYTDEEKIVIGKNYMLPKVIAESGLPSEVVIIKDEIWPMIVRPLGYDAGMRTLERTIVSIIRRIAREFIEGKIRKVVLDESNIRQYLPS
jgi:ATP-dependent Lon protease